MRLELRTPKPGTAFAVHHDRLALFHKAADAREYWRRYWEGGDAAQRLRTAATGVLDSDFDPSLALTERWISSGARVLEGGCGPGHLVAALGARGYQAIGIDYVPEVVRRAKNILPGLDIRDGDVEALPFADDSLDGYLSLGVIEHFEHGPTKAIAEARRVLRSGGIGIFEVPFLNPVRARHLALLRRRTQAPLGGLSFHQYYLSRDELFADFAAHNFEVLEEIPNCWEAVVFREHAVVAPFWKSRLAIGRIREPIRRIVHRAPLPIRRRYAHTMAFACRRL